MKMLIIAEKPSVAASISKALFSNVVKKKGYFDCGDVAVSWSVGHLVDLAEPELYNKAFEKWNLETLPIIPESFKLVPNKNTMAQLKVIKEIAKTADVIVNACDSGREGELIFRRIYGYLKLNQPIKRLWTPSMTDQALKEAYFNMDPGEKYDGLFNAAVARSEADWLIGINGTRAFTKKHGELLSVGRVQTPVLALCYERQRAIDEFQVENFFTVEGLFSQGETQYVGVWEGDRIFQKDLALQIEERVIGRSGVISSYEKTLEKVMPPLLHSLSTLQTEANKIYGYSAKQTLDVAQALYETHKLITYPRTGSNYVTEAEIPMMHSIMLRLKERFPNKYEAASLGLVTTSNKRVCNAAKVDDHHALLPTGEVVASQLTQEEQNIYELIVRRFMGQFYSAAVFVNHEVHTVVNQETFKTKIRQLKEMGWKVLYNSLKNEDRSSSEEAHLINGEFILDASMPVSCSDVQVKERQTTPPRPYTEGTLLSAMKTAGKTIEDDELRENMKGLQIGTEATRAAIIERLKKVDYIEIKKKNIFITDKGRELIELVRAAGLNVLTSAELTGKWEQRLDQIAKGGSKEAFMSQVIKLSRHIVDTVKKQESSAVLAQHRELPGRNAWTCPACGKGMIRENAKAFGCSNWKEGCKFTIWKQAFGKNLSQKQVESLILKGETGFLKFKSKAGKPFDAKLKLKDKSTGSLELLFKASDSRIKKISRPSK